MTVSVMHPAPPRRSVRRAMVVALGCAWLLLGFLSDNVPWFTEPVWIVLCGFAAGSAFALAHHTTVFALRRYTLFAAIIGILRSLAYASEDAYGPMVVWVVLVLTTVIAAAVLEAQNVAFRNGG